jgi:hypothetical protein
LKILTGPEKDGCPSGDDRYSGNWSLERDAQMTSDNTHDRKVIVGEKPLAVTGFMQFVLGNVQGRARFPKTTFG